MKVILQDIKEHPLEGIGTPQRVDYASDGYWERRYNGSGIIYYFYENDCAVVISIVNELLPSHEELPAKLQAMSKEDYAQVIRLMEANRGHADDPKVGIFWYNVAWKELFGVVSHPLRDYIRANASEGRITCSEMHEDVWKKEYNRQKFHGDGKGPFIGPYENKPSNTLSTGTSASAGCNPGPEARIRCCLRRSWFPSHLQRRRRQFADTAFRCPVPDGKYTACHTRRHCRVESRKA